MVSAYLKPETFLIAKNKNDISDFKLESLNVLNSQNASIQSLKMIRFRPKVISLKDKIGQFVSSGEGLQLYKIH